METAKDKELYKQVKKRADKIYKTHGLYKSAWIQKEYKRLGGKYYDEKPGATKGLQRWLKGEKWIELEPYLKDGTIVLCGSGGIPGKACRPLKRVNSKTPITVPELIRIHGKDGLKKLVRKKQKDPEGRMYWETGTFVASK